MKVKYFFALIVVLCAGCQTQFNVTLPTAPPPGKTQILVTFVQQPGAQIVPGGSQRSYRQSADWGVPLYLQERIKEIETEFDIEKQTGWLMDSIGVHCVVFLADAQRDVDQLINSIRVAPGVDFAQRMQSFTVMSTAPTSNENTFHYNDDHLTVQYGSFVEQLSMLHAITRGKTVKVGVVDTMSDRLHPDLNGQIASQIIFVKSGTADNVAEFAQHGTAVAGIIAAKGNNGVGLVGLAPEAELHVYAACDTDNSGPARCNTFNVLQSIEQAIKDQVQVLNLSIAGPHDQLIEKVLQVAQTQGMVIVAAVNSSSPENSFPATMTDVVAVQEVIAKQDNDLFGDWLVKSEKLSTLSGGGYQFFYGSSISTASVSAIAALYRSAASAAETRQMAAALAAGDCAVVNDKLREKFAQVLQQSTTCQW